MKKRILAFSVMTIILVFSLNVNAQKTKKKKKKEKTAETELVQASGFNQKDFSGMVWRNIGPFRGGRSTTVCGVVQNPLIFYFGSTGGGIWKTQDGGATYTNISDGFVKTGSVGALDVNLSDPNVIYAGMGEAPVRGVMTSHGDGVYKSTDAGATWSHKGLPKSRQISQIRSHPDNPDLVYAAVQGSPYQPTSERGIYRSEDGGENWEKVLFVNDSTGASDLTMDYTNPRILYAAFWQHQRLPWKVVSGGKGSSIWKTTDGGDTWTKLEEGLPADIMGKIGISVSKANSSRVYAIIEAEKGGLYRSDNGGKKWQLVNGDRILRARSWYYMHVFANPHDEDHVVVLNAPYLESRDGGKSFKTIATPHGDNHALWFHPEDPSIVINGNDGGANISYNGGKTWSIQSNQPTAQFYRVNADNRFPYWVYGGQQDNSTVAIPSQTQYAGIPNQDFHSVGGCESAFCAFDPDDPRLVYAGCYQGIITEYDMVLKQTKDVMAYPFLGLGENAKDLKYRFNWNAPILVSQHDPEVIYHAGNRLLKSTDRGISWQEVSPDLTKNDSTHIGMGGGPITSEGAGGEVYHTIMYVAESPRDPKTLWVGTDDGLIHITRNGGQDWINITPRDLEEGMINSIDLSIHDQGTAYVAFNRYKFNDFTPHVYITKDYGKTWLHANQGFGMEAHVRVVREDPEKKGLLYAGTETGLYISFDQGEVWDSFQLNLPIVPITDLKVHHGDLLAATQGRAFWILDDLTPIRNYQPSNDQISFAVYQPRDPILFGGPKVKSSTMGSNPDFGLSLYFYNPSENDSLKMKIRLQKSTGDVLRVYEENAKLPADNIIRKKGLNKFVWNLRKPNKHQIKGLMTLGGNSGPRVTPGGYQVTVILGKDSISHNFSILPDPRKKQSEEDFDEKTWYLDTLHSAGTLLYKKLLEMQQVKAQISQLIKRKEIDFTLIQGGKDLIRIIDSLDGKLVQRKQKTFQDVINFPNQLDAKIKHIESTIDGADPPLTYGQKERAREMLANWEEVRQIIMELIGEKLSEFNQKIKEAEVPFIHIK